MTPNPFSCFDAEYEQARRERRALRLLYAVWAAALSLPLWWPL